jgi:uncharacterized protein (DUF1499 family)
MAPSPRTILSRAVFVLALACAAAAAAAGFGTRLEWWHFTTGFSILRWAAYGAVAGVAVSAVATYLCRGSGAALGWSAAGLIISLIIVAIPVSWLYAAMRLPRIHDITTDTGNPPQFVAILPLRRNAPDSVEYGGSTIAEHQRKAYPDIQPLVIDRPAAEVFKHALAVARNLGWEVVAADSDKGRIEATDTTFWFGFKDDVVVRIQSVPQGSRVDVRSVSRVGLSDVGTNAARIHRFLAEMKVR